MLMVSLLSYPLRFIPRRTVVPILRGPLRGKKWIVGSFVHRCWLGSYEIDFQRALAKDVKPGGVFYDVGANVGFYSLLASKLIFPGRVYAFEPMRENIPYLRSHLELNRVKNVELLEIAVSDECGFASFTKEASRAMGHLEPGGSASVRTYTLDALIHENRTAPPDYIKMDIEGGEFRALVGAKDCFARFRPTLFLATHGKDVHEDCCRLLESWQYTVKARPSGQDRAEVVAHPKTKFEPVN